MAKEIWYNIQIGMKNISSEEWDWNQVNMYAYPRLLWHPELSANSMWAITAGGHMGKAAAPMLKHWLVLQETREQYPSKKAERLALLNESAGMTTDTNEPKGIRPVEETWSHIK